MSLHGIGWLTGLQFQDRRLFCNEYRLQQFEPAMSEDWGRVMPALLRRLTRSGSLGFECRCQIRPFNCGGVLLSAAFSEEVGTFERCEVGKTMQVESGRLEKRVRLSVPVVISSVDDPPTVERTTTENVCSMGARLVTEHAKGQNEQLMICSPVGDQGRLARVVYCQQQPDGLFKVGVKFETMSSKELTNQ
jgi:hypothetical protein